MKIILRSSNRIIDNYFIKFHKQFTHITQLLIQRNFCINFRWLNACWIQQFIFLYTEFMIDTFLLISHHAITTSPEQLIKLILLTCITRIKSQKFNQIFTTFSIMQLFSWKVKLALWTWNRSSLKHVISLSFYHTVSVMNSVFLFF